MAKHKLPFTCGGLPQLSIISIFAAAMQKENELYEVKLQIYMS